MATTELLSQPFSGQLGDYLIEQLTSSRYQTLNVVVAFAKNSGDLRLKKALERFRKNGSTVNAYVGIDLDGTSYEALTALLSLSDSLFVIHAESDQTFHPKIYDFSSDTEALVIVGSHNLTGGGLWTNVESSAIIHIDTDGTISVHDQVEEYLLQLRRRSCFCVRIENQSTIDKLLADGYVSKEVTGQIRRATAAKAKLSSSPSREVTFVQSLKAYIPDFTPSINEAHHSVRNVAGAPSTATRIGLENKSEGSQTLWIATGAMTGGSRNILDLSKRALVAHGDPSIIGFSLGEQGYMRGAVQFFGIDPADTEENRNITVNYNGTDFAGNSVIYPSGNGTWRLQIHGISSTGKKITSEFDPGYLAKKIITFTKINDGYFFMSVFSGEDLSEFVSVSLLVAYNGATKRCREFGIIL